jgi:hypothetical protein
MAMSGFKVTLGSGKVVLFRKMKISDHANAAEAAGLKFQTTAGQQAETIKELVKQLLYKVDEKELTGLEKEDLDALFEMEEYSQLLEVVGKTTGLGEKKTAPKLEIVNIGKP